MQDYFDELDKDIESLQKTPSVKAEDKTSSVPEVKEKSSSKVEVIKKEKKVISINPTRTHKKWEKKDNNNFRNKRNDNRKGGRAGKFVSNFPDVKFYLPSLREGYTRYMTVGGNNEIGSKNMGILQYNDDIVIVDCGIQFPEDYMYGVNYSVPDVSFLTKYKKNIKALLITHAHLDHIGSLKHVYPALGCPPLYATRFTLGLIRKQFEEAGLMSQAQLIEVDASKEEQFKAGEFTVEYVNITHSVPDCAGIYIESPGGTKVFHTGDFKIDYTPRIDPAFDTERFRRIGDRGISLLLSDSTASMRPGFSVSEKDVGEELDKIITEHKSGRLIIAIFSSWISRVQQLIDSAQQHEKHIFLSGRSMVDNVAIAKELGVLNVPQGVIKKMTPKNTDGIPAHKQIIITTGSQWEEFSALTRMAEGKHNAMEIISGDTVIFSSSVVPGNDASVAGVINKLLYLGANVITKEHRPVHTGGHAFQEEQKVIIELMRPKYLLPVFGDLYFRSAHKETALWLGMKEENILMVDNGQIVDFAPSNGPVFKSKIKAPIQEVIIDGYGMWLATSHVFKAREQMMNSGTLVVLFKVDKRTKAILGHIKLESRGFVYVDEVRNLHASIIKKSREIYENTIKDVPDMEEKDFVKILRADLEKFILYKIDREPMIIPMFIQV